MVSRIAQVAVPDFLIDLAYLIVAITVYASVGLTIRVSAQVGVRAPTTRACLIQINNVDV